MTGFKSQRNMRYASSCEIKCNIFSLRLSGIAPSIGVNRELFQILHLNFCQHLEQSNYIKPVFGEVNNAMFPPQSPAVNNRRLHKSHSVIILSHERDQFVYLFIIVPFPFFFGFNFVCSFFTSFNMISSFLLYVWSSNVCLCQP